MWMANPTWGSPKIVLELRKLGIDVAKSTVENYQPKGPRPSSPGWRAFLRLHATEFAAMDFFVVPTAELKVLFVLVILGPDRRRVLHFNVTEHPTAEWTAQQLIEVFPFESAPRYLLRDGDAIYGEKVRRKLRAIGALTQNLFRLLQPMAHTSVAGGRRAKQQTGTSSVTRTNCRNSGCPRASSLLSSRGCMSFRDPQLR